MIDLFLSNKRISNFLKQKKISNCKKHMKDLSVTRVNPLLRNFGYYKNSTQIQNVFKTTTRNLLGIRSVHVKLSNKFISCRGL